MKVQAQRSNKYNNLKHILDTHLKDSYVIPDSVQSELKEYKLVYWSVDYLYAKIKLGKLIRNDTEYNVTYQNCSITDLYELAISAPDRQIRISFRQARSHWNLPASCIIKLPVKLNSKLRQLS